MERQNNPADKAVSGLAQALLKERVSITPDILTFMVNRECEPAANMLLAVKEPIW
jgi:hypothetical protein